MTLNAVEDRRLDVVAAVHVDGLAAKHQICLCTPPLDLGEDRPVLRRGDDRADGFVLDTGADLERGGLGHHQIQQVIVDGRNHDRSRAGRALLALIPVCAADQGVGGQIEVGGLVDDQSPSLPPISM